VERLPWLLRRALEAGEAARVREHLRACASCRLELDETRWALEFFAAHASAEALVALAWDAPAADVDLDLARRHVAGCEACAGELSLARQSRADSRRPAPVRVTTRRERRPRDGKGGLR
jgi:hypothetical protein